MSTMLVLVVTWALGNVEPIQIGPMSSHEACTSWIRDQPAPATPAGALFANYSCISTSGDEALDSY